MEQSLFLKYQKGFDLVDKAVQRQTERIRPVYEVASLFVIELNKSAGQTYTTKDGKKGKSIFYNEILVMKDLKKLGISNDVHKVNGFFAECEKSSLGFRFYYKCKLKEVANKKLKVQK